MRITIQPTRAIVTIGNPDGSVGIETVDYTAKAIKTALSNYGVDQSEAETNAFDRWIKSKDRKVGDLWTVVEISRGDNAGSVVLV